ncbi:hypothetical protein WDZ16_03030 [Pseudokineococcus marinus]|uniref:hypothetical protein n=1 Tax=Pseudokineococcus marinus TaxID=351215 RepID=UPI003095C706
MTRAAGGARAAARRVPVADERARRRRATAAAVGLGLSLGASAAFLGALLQPRRRVVGYDPRRPR